MSDDELPPLPEPQDVAHSNYMCVYAFTAKQMRSYGQRCRADAKAEIERLRAECDGARGDRSLLNAITNLRDSEIERLRGLLVGALDLAEFWFMREDRRDMSEDQYKTWHALGYGSNAYRNGRAALKEQDR